MIRSILEHYAQNRKSLASPEAREVNETLRSSPATPAVSLQKQSGIQNIRRYPITSGLEGGLLIISKYGVGVPASG